MIRAHCRLMSQGERPSNYVRLQGANGTGQSFTDECNLAEFVRFQSFEDMQPVSGEGF